MGLVSNLKTVFRTPNRRDVEQVYLDEATSAVDLEMRQREIDRGRFRSAPHRR